MTIGGKIMLLNYGVKHLSSTDMPKMTCKKRRFVNCCCCYCCCRMCDVSYSIS